METEHAGTENAERTEQEATRPPAGRVLIADDDSDFAALVCQILTHVGFECQHVADGVAVHRLLRQSEFDAILLDYDMPGNRNLECLQHIARRYSDTPVLLLTGYPSLPSAVDSLKLRIFDYITKPFKPPYLQRAVAEAIEWKRLRFGSRGTERRLQNLPAAADVVIVHGRHGRILDVSGAGCQRFGYAAAALIGRRVADLIVSPNAEAIGQTCPDFGQHTLAPIRAIFQARNGEVVPCDVLQRQILWQGERVIQSVVMEVRRERRPSGRHPRRLPEAALSAITRMVNESLNLNQVFTRSLQETLAAAQAQWGAFFLFEHDAELVGVARRGLHADLVKSIEALRGPALEIFRRMTDSDRPGAIKDLARLPEPVRQAATRAGVRSFFLVPVRSRGLPLGLVLLAYPHERVPDRGTLRMLELIGSQIGVAVENGRLYSAIIDSERRYRQLFESIADPVLLHMADGRIEAVNHAAAALLKRSEIDLLGEQLHRVGAADYAQAVQLQAARADPEGRFPPFECVLRAADEQALEFEVRARVVLNEGRPCILSVLHDVTDRKSAERNRNLVNAIRQAIWHCETAAEFLDEAVRRIAEFTQCACVRIRTVSADNRVTRVAEIGFDPQSDAPDPADPIPPRPALLTVPADKGADRSAIFTEAGSFFSGRLSALRNDPKSRQAGFGPVNLLASPYESVALVPIPRSESTIGLLHVADREPGRITRRTAHVLEEIAATIASGLYRFELLEVLDWETRRTEIGYEMTAAVLSGTPLEKVVGRVLSQLTDHTEFEIAAIDRVDPEQNELLAWLARGPAPDATAALETVVPCEACFAGRVALTGEALLDADLQAEPDALPPRFRAPDVQSYCAFPIRRHERILAVLSLGSRRRILIRPQEIKFLHAIADQLAVAISWVDSQTALDRSRHELRLLSAQLIRAQEDERTRIARELHDSLGQLLASISIDIDRRAARLSPDETPREGFLSRVRLHLNEAHAMVRHLTASLRPGILDDLGLVPALEAYFDEFEARTGIACVMQNNLGDLPIGPDVSTVLYRLAQEAATNAACHGQPQCIEARLELTPNRQILFSIHDDGRGFDPASLDWRTCFGLIGMRERLQLVNGRLQILSHPGAGTTIRATAPLENSQP